MGVLDIAWSEPVSTPESLGTARYMLALQKMGQELVLLRFRAAFLNLANFACLPRRDGAS